VDKKIVAAIIWAYETKTLLVTKPLDLPSLPLTHAVFLKTKTLILKRRDTRKGCVAFGMWVKAYIYRGGGV
jgi:hypothetical protein